VGQRAERNQGEARFGWQRAKQTRGYQCGEGIFLIVTSYEARQLRGIVFDGAPRQAHAEGIAFKPTSDAERLMG
jgi:hypothetical protein